MQQVQERHSETRPPVMLSIPPSYGYVVHSLYHVVPPLPRIVLPSVLVYCFIASLIHSITTMKLEAFGYLFGTLAVFLLFWWTIRKSVADWKKYGNLAITFSDSGILVASARGETQAFWANYHTCTAKPQSILLTGSKPGFKLYIPTSTFPDTETMERFRKIVVAHVDMVRWDIG